MIRDRSNQQQCLQETGNKRTTRRTRKGKNKWISSFSLLCATPILAIAVVICNNLIFTQFLTTTSGNDSYENDEPSTNNNNNNNNKNYYDFYFDMLLDKKQGKKETEKKKSQQQRPNIDDNDNNQNSTDNSSFSSDDSDFHTIIWPKLSNQFCPNPYEPNYKLARTILFPLAAKQLGLISGILFDDDDNIFRGGGDYELADNFYSGTFASNVIVSSTSTTTTATTTTTTNNRRKTIIYIPIWKCANDQIRSYLLTRYNNNNNTATTTTTKKKPPPPSFSATATATTTSVYNQSSSSTSTHPPQSPPPPPPPCTITVIRDPISHFLSGYNEIEYRIMEEEEKQKDGGGSSISSTTTASKAVMDDHHHHSNPYRVKESFDTTHKDLPYRTFHEIGSTERFEQFLKDLIGKGNGSKMRHWYMMHIYSMSRVLSTYTVRKQLVQKRNNRQQQQNVNQGVNKEQEHDEPFLTGYLSTLDNLTYTFPSFLEDTCGTSNDDNGHDHNNNGEWMKMKKMPISGQHDSSKDQFGTYKAAKKVWYQQGDTAKALCILHLVDYACWTKLHKNIPKICRNVYSESDFIQTIVKANNELVERQQRQEQRLQRLQQQTQTIRQPQSTTATATKAKKMSTAITTTTAAATHPKSTQSSKNNHHPPKTKG